MREKERKKYIPSVTSIDISSLLLITAADIEWVLLCLHWSSIRLLRGDITMHICLLDCCNVSKIKGGQQKANAFAKTCRENSHRVFLLKHTFNNWNLFISQFKWKFMMLLNLLGKNFPDINIYRHDISWRQFLHQQTQKRTPHF